MKKIPRSYEQDDPKSMIRKAQKKESAKEKGSGGIKHEAKEYIKELKGKSYHAKKGRK